MEKRMEKAKVLIEALPYIKEFYGRHVVIKYGGNAMIDENLKRAFALNMVLLKYIGVDPVVVHGGGPQIGKMLSQLNIPSRFTEGYRVTDEATMDVVEMVLVGKVNKEIVNLSTCTAAGPWGSPARTAASSRPGSWRLAIKPKDAPPEIIDLGKVGEVVHINTRVIEALERENIIPVIAPVGVDEEGDTYNINADSVAGALAAALGAKRLHLLTDVPGLLDKEGNLISSLTVPQALKGFEDGTITGGMIPKIKCCLEALAEGVEKAHIIDGRVENSVILELFTTRGIGTEIVRG